MAILTLPAERRTEKDFSQIQAYLALRGIEIHQWPVLPRSEAADPQTILDLYHDRLQPYMARHGYQTADVIAVDAQTPNLAEIRHKFLREHTHAEDEVRYFLAGQGHFWFHLDAREDEVFCVTCHAGDLLSVPTGVKHWFDLGDPPGVRVIRMFTDVSGWVPHYTDSALEAQYHGVLA